MQRRTVTVAIVALAGLALAACRSERPAASAAADSATGSTTAALPVVNVTATDFKFDAPAEVGVAATVGLAVAGLFEFNFGDTEVFYTLLNVYALVAVSIEQQPEPLANEAPMVLVPAT